MNLKTPSPIAAIGALLLVGIVGSVFLIRPIKNLIASAIYPSTPEGVYIAFQFDPNWERSVRRYCKDPEFILLNSTEKDSTNYLEEGRNRVYVDETEIHAPPIKDGYSTILIQRPWNHNLKAPLFFKKIHNQWKLDLVSSRPFQPMSLLEYKATMPHKPLTWRFIAEYRNHKGEPGFGTNYVHLYEPYKNEEIYGIFYDANNAEYETLFDLLKDEKKHLITIDLQYPNYGANSDYAQIVGIHHPGWVVDNPVNASSDSSQPAQ